MSADVPNWEWCLWASLWTEWDCWHWGRKQHIHGKWNRASKVDTGMNEFLPQQLRNGGYCIRSCQNQQMCTSVSLFRSISELQSFCLRWTRRMHLQNGIVASLLAETFRLFYSKHELLFQLLVALIWREIQTIKAAWKNNVNIKYYHKYNINSIKCT